jgi:translation initiation factor 2 subunit 3
MATTKFQIQTIRLSEVIEKQAVLNIGTAGHVAHGKSTLVKKLTGVATQRFKSEKERNITIRLGYADAKIYKNAITGDIETNVVSLTKKIPIHHVSFVDCPGHELYMATMVSGSQVMDYCVVVVAANEVIPQPQTFEHLMALDYSGIPQTKMIYLVNKLDLLKPKRAEEVIKELREFLTREFPYTEQDPSGHIIYPISAATGDNVNHVLRHIVSLPVSPKLVNRPARMFIVRSYNANKPSTPIEEMIGGIAGGSIVQGVLSVGDKVEIRPGVINMVNGKRVIQPLIATVETLRSDTDELQVAVPGGLIGVGLSIYAGLTNDDRLKGQILGHIGTLPEMFDVIEGRYRLIKDRALPDVNGRVNVIVNGVMNVEATVNKIKPSKKEGRGDIQLTLSSPVVIDLDDSDDEEGCTARLAIMFDNKLIAALTVKRATLSLPIHYPEDADLSWKPKTYEIVNDVTQPMKTPEKPDIKTLLSGIRYTKGQCKREPIPVPNITIINTCSYIHEKEFNQMLTAITHEDLTIRNKVDMKQVLIDNIAIQLANSSPRFNGEGNLTMSGRFKQSKIRQFLKDFDNKIMTCPSCTSTASVIYRDRSGVITRRCTVCNIDTFLTSLNMSQLMGT